MYNYYISEVVSIAVSYLHGNKLVKDCAHDAIIKFFEALEDGEVIQQPKAWLRRVASRICLDCLKREAHRMNYVAMLQENHRVEQGEWDQNYSDEWHEECNRIFWREIRNFTHTDQFITLAKYYYQYTYAEIAELMSRDVDFLRDRTNYVRRTIRKKYKR